MSSNTNRWSRQSLSAPNTPASAAAASSNTARSERRLSRLSASEFDSILSSDQTLVLAATDESQLGKVPPTSFPTAAESAVVGQRTVPSTSPVSTTSSAAPHRQLQPSTEPDSLRPRGSISSRASNPDLGASTSGGEASSRRRQSADANNKDDSYRLTGPPPTPAKDSRFIDSAADAQATRRATQAQMAFASSPSDTSSARRPSATSDQSIAVAATAQRSARSSLSGVPAVVSLASGSKPPAQSGSNNNKSVTSFATTSSSPVKQMSASAAGAASAEPHRSAFSNTMRKTSRFFKRFGGGDAAVDPPSAKTAAVRSPAIDTPIAQVYQSPPRTTQQPLSPPGLSALTPSAEATSQRMRTESESMNRTPSPPPKTASTAMARASSNQSTESNPRRRSVSLSSYSPKLLPQSHPQPSASLTPPSGRPGLDHRLSRTEEDRLYSELKGWKLDDNGVLIGEGLKNGTPSPVASRTTNSGGKRRLDLPTFAPDPAGTGRKASWQGAAGTHSDDPDEPVVTQRSKSLPPAGVGIDTDQRAVSTPLASSSDQPPAIRLVSPATSLKDLPPAPASAPAPSNPADAESLGDTPGLGLSTIIESAHSRDNSLVSSPVSPQVEDALVTGKNDSQTSVPHETSPATMATPLPSFAVTGSPASGTPHSTFSSTSNQRSPLSRQSIVAHPLAHRTPSSASSKTAMPSLDPNLPFEEQAQTAAQRCWDEDASFIEARKMAEWLGSAGRLNAATLERWIHFFDFSGARLDVAFRRLCDKLYLKAETQQVDRILAQFSRRYFDNNPKGVYGSADVVHAVSYSLLLLNTDLHIVDTTTRMTRAQFVRNTLAAVHAQTEADDQEPATNPALLFGAGASSRRASAGPGEGVFGGSHANASSRSLGVSSGPRNASIVSLKGVDNAQATSTPPIVNERSASPELPRREDSPERFRNVRSESIVTVNSAKSNEAGLEALLKDMYSAIKAQPIFQPQGSTSSSLSLLPTSHSRSSLSLTPGSSPYATWSGGINRSASRRSATSTMSAGSSSVYNKRSSIRGFGSLLGPSSSLELTRSSSPTPSAATSIDDEKYSTAYGSQHQVQTIGFANSLSHTIIREQHEDDQQDTSDLVDISEEELALLGAPWAKEGLLQRKHYWETTGKRAKEKTWLQAFVVISAGQVKMFRFDTSGSSRGPSGGVGGGDWTSNAQSVGDVSLIHALCSAMPPPGYSRDRPHCFVLTLPSGGSYFFQAGTQDLVGEWVSTCNYWSARLSKEPLSGGVSNMEYGWSRVDNTEDASPRQRQQERDDTMSIRSGHSRRSYQHMMGSSHAATSNPNDRILINDWKPPNPPAGASQLTEDAQLENLKRHVAIIKTELATHNNLRAPMTKLYSPRSMNGAKAAANWERKSQHLLAETVKYQTYIDALASAIKLRALKLGQREIEAMLETADAAVEEDEDLPLISPTDGPPPVLAPMVVVDQEQSGEDDEEDGDMLEPPTRSRVPTMSTISNGDDDEFLDAQAGSPKEGEDETVVSVT